MVARRQLAIVTAVAACLAGVSVAIKPELALLIVGLSAVIVLALVLPLYAIVNLVIVASFLSRITVLALGFHVRPEHVTALLLFVKILTYSGRKRMGPSGLRAVIAMALLVVLNLVATVLNSPNEKSSFDIVGWLVMDTVLLASLVQVPVTVLRRAVLRTGLACALLMGILAIGFWVLAEAGGPLIGVQADPLYGGYAAYVGSSEANVAAGLLVLWGLIALASLRSGESVTWVNRWAAVVCPLALIATDTREAILAYVVGVAVLAVRRGALRIRHVLIGVVIVTLGVAVLSLGGHSGSFGRSAAKLSSFTLASGDGALRVQSWSVAVHDMSEQQVLIGLGTNSFGQRHFDPTLPGLDKPWYLPSLPLQTLYDAGGIAVACVIALLLFALPKERRARSLGYAMAAAYLVVSMATSPFWFSFTWIFVALALLHRDDERGTVVLDADAVSAVPLAPRSHQLQTAPRFSS